MADVGAIHTVTVTIANGATTSGAAEVRPGGGPGFCLIGIQTPAALTGTSFTFTASATSAGTFTTLYDSSGNIVTVQVGTSRWIGLDPVSFASVAFVKVVSSGAEGAARSIVLALRRVS